jgi:hypothetical protein
MERAGGIPWKWWTGPTLDESSLFGDITLISRWKADNLFDKGMTDIAGIEQFSKIISYGHERGAGEPVPYGEKTSENKYCFQLLTRSQRRSG